MVTLDPRNIDTVVVSSHEDGFLNVFLEKACWYPLFLSHKIIPKLSYLAIYRTLPISAVTHFAKIEEILPCENKYHTYYAKLEKDSITTLSNPVIRDRDKPGPRGIIYTNIEKLKTSKTLRELTTNL